MVLTEDALEARARRASSFQPLAYLWGSGGALRRWHRPFVARTIVGTRGVARISGRRRSFAASHPDARTKCLLDWRKLLAAMRSALSRRGSTRRAGGRCSRDAPRRAQTAI